MGRKFIFLLCTICPVGAFATGVPKVDLANIVLVTIQESIEEAAREVVYNLAESKLGLEAELTESLLQTRVNNTAQQVAMETDTMTLAANINATALMVPPSDACALYTQSKAVAAASERPSAAFQPFTMQESSRYLKESSGGRGEPAKLRDESIKRVHESFMEGFMRLHARRGDQGFTEEGSIFTEIMNRSYDDQSLEDSSWFEALLLGQPGQDIYNFDIRDTSDNKYARMYPVLSDLAQASVAQELISGVVSRKRQLSGRKLNKLQLSKLIGVGIDDPLNIAMFERERGNGSHINESADLVLSVSLSSTFESGLQISKSGADEEVSADIRRRAVQAAAEAHEAELTFRRKQNELLVDAARLINKINRN